MKKSCLCFLAIVTSIVLGIWGMFAYYNHYYIERFRLEHSNLERRSSVIDDLYGRTLEEKGQSYFVNSDFLYTYGKVGFIIINRRNGNIKVFQDKIVDNLIERKYSYYKTQIREKEGLSKPYLTVYNNLMDLNDEERNMYYKLKNTYIEFPGYDIIPVDKNF